MFSSSLTETGLASPFQCYANALGSCDFRNAASTFDQWIECRCSGSLFAWRFVQVRRNFSVRRVYQFPRNFSRRPALDCTCNRIVVCDSSGFNRFKWSRSRRHRMRRLHALLQFARGNGVYRSKNTSSGFPMKPGSDLSLVGDEFSFNILDALLM
jgi:hypothetical protein